MPARLAELAEDVPQAAVHVLEHRGPVGEVQVVERGQPLNGRVDAGIPGGGGSRLLPF
jgi:hypothetical protein